VSRNFNASLNIESITRYAYKLYLCAEKNSSEIVKCRL